MVFEYITDFFKWRRRWQKVTTHISYHDLHILLVDDSTVCRKITKCLLYGLGFKYIDEAKNGYECIEKTNNQSYDIILMDDDMTGISGRETVLLLRHNGFYKLIIGLTGEHREDVLLQFIENGANYVLKKPFIGDEFQEIVEKYFIFLPEFLYKTNKIFPAETQISNESTKTNNFMRSIKQNIIYPIMSSSV